jgi:DNA mismatch repair protein MutS
LIRPGYSAQLDALRGTAADGRNWLLQFEADERKRTGIKNLRIKYTQPFGFFIEVTKSNLGRVPPDYQRKATVSNAERFFTPALKAREAEILAAEDRADDLEYDLFCLLRREMANHSARLRAAAGSVAELDALCSLAETAARDGYVRPAVDEGDQIVIKGGRHPVVERSLPDGERFVPNDTRLNGSDDRLLIITGPNMAGKSVYIRQVALITLMAQMGSFVPAESAHIGVADRIFTRAGLTDDIAHGQSTFLVEMSETSYILRHATPRSLVVLDEVGRGTSTYDGMSIAWAVGEYLSGQVRARTLFATHFHELTGLAEKRDGVVNYALAVGERAADDDRPVVVFLRRLVPGGSDRSYGVQVARLAGLPGGVIERAEAVLRELEAKMTSVGGEGVRQVREPDAAYSPSGDPFLKELVDLDLANMTPVALMARIDEMQKRLRDEGQSVE